MKNTKWLWWTLGTLLVAALVVGAGFAAYRMGYAQGTLAGQDGSVAQGMPRFHMRGFDNDFRDGIRQFHMPGFNRFDGRRGGILPFFGLFGGLLRLAVLGLIIWGGYMLIKNSGWRLVREQAPVSAPVDEKKE